MLKDTYPYYLANEAVYANTDLDVTDKFSGKVATRVALADAKAIDAAIGAAVAAEKPMRELPAYRRQAVLDHCVARFRERFDELAEALCIEAGKPINDSKGEVTRLIDTFRVASEESVRIDGEVIGVNTLAGAFSYLSILPVQDSGLQLLALGSLLGSLIGFWLGLRLRDHHLKTGFAVLLLGLIALMVMMPPVS